MTAAKEESDFKDLLASIDDESIIKFNLIIDWFLNLEEQYLDRYVDGRNYHISDHEASIAILKQIKKKIK